MGTRTNERAKEKDVKQKSLVASKLKCLPEAESQTDAQGYNSPVRKSSTTHRHTNIYITRIHR